MTIRREQAGCGSESEEKYHARENSKYAGNTRPRCMGGDREGTEWKPGEPGFVSVPASGYTSAKRENLGKGGNVTVVDIIRVTTALLASNLGRTLGPSRSSW